MNEMEHEIAAHRDGAEQRKRIPLFRPLISEEAIEAVGEVLRSGWLGAGPRTLAFERAFAEYIGVPHCVGVSSCTAALHLALRVLDLPSGSEVITTALTFVSTNHVILYEGLKPVFADVQQDSGNLDINSVANRITRHTGAIILVHYGGYPCDLEEFYKLADAHGIPIIEDCAHACGATYKGQRIGSHGRLHAFSFSAVKNLPMGEGGALTVRSPEYASRLRRLRWMGIDADTFGRSERAHYRWEYNVSEVGYNYTMNDILAAIGLVQLQYLEAGNARRAAIAMRYREGLTGIQGIQLLQQRDDRTSAFHLFSILVERRDALVARMHEAGIDIGVHYRRNDEFPMYEAQDLPQTEYFWRRVISLPMHLCLTDEQVDYVISVIHQGW